MCIRRQSTPVDWPAPGPEGQAVGGQITRLNTAATLTGRARDGNPKRQRGSASATRVDLGKKAAITQRRKERKTPRLSTQGSDPLEYLTRIEILCGFAPLRESFLNLILLPPSLIPHRFRFVQVKLEFWHMSNLPHFGRTHQSHWMRLPMRRMIRKSLGTQRNVSA